MKKLSVILSVVALGLSITAFTFVLLRSASTTSSFVSNPDAPVIASGSVVFVNIDSLMRGYDMYFDVQKDFEAKAKKKDGDFTARMKKFETDARDFQNKVEKGLITRSQAQQLQEGLAKREQELMQLRQQLQMELQEEEAVMLRQIQSNIHDYIQEYNKEKGYSLILSNSGNNVLLYGASSLNITSEVLKGLNANYVKQRK
ncbi:MAG: OmpH family outer membrane protein [Bacteroidales bacterium]